MRAVINPNCAFGINFFSENSFNQNLFSIFLSLVFLGLFLFIFKSRSKSLGYKLILIGAVSNILSRVFFGGVVDYFFIPATFGIFPSLSFNLADVLVVFGIILLSKVLFF